MRSRSASPKNKQHRKRKAQLNRIDMRINLVKQYAVALDTCSPFGLREVIANIKKNTLLFANQDMIDNIKQKDDELKFKREVVPYAALSISLLETIERMFEFAPAKL